MTVAWMIFGVGAAALFAVAAWALERALDSRGASLRTTWVVGIVGTLLLPAGLWLSPRSAGAGAARNDGALVDPTALELHLTALSGPSVVSPGAESLFTWLWVLSSACMISLVALTEVDFARRRRRWRSEEIDGIRVLISPDVGPAVAGLLSSRVVLPEWAFRGDRRARSIMLRHEVEHIEARDPLLIAVSLGVLALAPWNLPLWWMHLRLRQAIEIDCDRRVLRRFGDAREYGMLLLNVARSAPRFWVGAAALAQTPSTLRRRVEHMTRSPRTPSWIRTISFICVAAAAALAACELPGPSGARVGVAAAEHGVSGPATVTVLGAGRYRLDDDPRIIAVGDLEGELRRRVEGVPMNQRVINVFVEDAETPRSAPESMVAMMAAARAGFRTARPALEEHIRAGVTPPSVDLTGLLARLKEPPQLDTVMCSVRGVAVKGVERCR